jgi:hypothetical protein
MIIETPIFNSINNTRYIFYSSLKLKYHLVFRLSPYALRNKLGIGRIYGNWQVPNHGLDRNVGWALPSGAFVFTNVWDYFQVRLRLDADHKLKVQFPLQGYWKYKSSIV